MHKLEKEKNFEEIKRKNPRAMVDKRAEQESEFMRHVIEQDGA